MDTRRDKIDEPLETYHPSSNSAIVKPNVRVFVQQDSESSEPQAGEYIFNPPTAVSRFREKLSHLNSLDSSRSWSSTEANESFNQIQSQQPETKLQQVLSSGDKRRQFASSAKLTNTVGKISLSRLELGPDSILDDDNNMLRAGVGNEDDEDEFYDSPTPRQRSFFYETARNSETLDGTDILDDFEGAGDIDDELARRLDKQMSASRMSLASMATVFEEDLLDDRQGMNRSEAQYNPRHSSGDFSTHRRSLDGSIASDATVFRNQQTNGTTISGSGAEFVFNRSRGQARHGSQVGKMGRRSDATAASLRSTHGGSGMVGGIGVSHLGKRARIGSSRSYGADSTRRRRRRSRSGGQALGTARSPNGALSSLFCGLGTRANTSSGGGRGSQRRNRQSKWARKLKLTKRHESIVGLQLSVMNCGLLSTRKLNKDLQSFLPKGKLSRQQFDERIKLMRKYEVLATIEYKFASRYEIYSSKHANLELNLVKNNHKKCIPYDYNRVVLKTLPTIPNSDYINASHVDSYLKPNAYIATQGPNENTINDFWRMVWEQKSFVIVMLTKVFDFIKVMCNQYWPVEVNKPEVYGNFEVTLLYEEPLADFVIRTIKLRKISSTKPSAAATGAAASSAANNNLLMASNKQSYDSKDRQADATEEPPVSDNELNNSGQMNIDDDPCNRPKIFNFNTSQGHQLNVRTPKYLNSESKNGLPAALANVCATADEKRQSMSQVSSIQQPPSPSQKSASQASQMLTSSQQSFNNLNNGLKVPSNLNLGDSLSSILSMSLVDLPETPTTPMSPRTPGSATSLGIDRTSATRRAVKKKRRVKQSKNSRPQRTQFLVPSESQLLDDDDVNNDEDYNEALGYEEYEEDAEDCEENVASRQSTQTRRQLSTNRASNCNNDNKRHDRSHQSTATSSTNQTNHNTNKQKKKKSGCRERIIYQFHYHSWASHTCPFISSLLHFRRRVRICMDEMSKAGKIGPIVVHCNDGCGRTGTYLCIDANLELADEDNCYDVYYYTKKLRQSRRLLIENVEQYKFVYDTIDEASFCGKTWFPVSELHKQLKYKSQRNAQTKTNEYQREYEKITRMTGKFSIGDCAGGHRVENRLKNRDVSTVPPDNFRPYLTSFQTNDNTDYINAVFVDGYTRSKEYIVTEWPLHRTISDFWSLIYDHDCNSIILLANPIESSTYPSFLPSEKELRRKFGPVFSAEMVSYTHYQNIKSWIYTISKKIVSLTEVMAGVKSETKTTQVFQITCWPQGHRVPTSTNALVELMNMVERWRQRTTYGPVCVVSLDGKSRAGVYCAANVAIEQVVQHNEVDVFQAVKTVRRHRPHLIENMTEYKYCYDLILHYVLHYLNKQSSEQ